jgi:hypothetical protein
MAEQIEQLIKRSRLAALIDKTPRTLRNMEIAGLLTPIKLNSRSTVYRMAEVNRLIQGSK